MHVILVLWRLASLAFGAVALLRLGAIADSLLPRGARTRIWWAAVVVLGGMGTLLPVGPAWVCWRIRHLRGDDRLAAPVVPPVPFADGVAVAPPAADPPDRSTAPGRSASSEDLA